MWDENFTFAKAQARKVITACDITEPGQIDLEMIAGTFNLVILESDIDGSDARLVRLGGTGIISIRKSIKELGRKRFAVAHELGHNVLHSKSQMSLCNESDFMDYYSKSSAETEANVFAAELLMPEGIFKKKCVCKFPSFKIIESIASDFFTSLTASSIRFVELTNFPCVLVASISGRTKWFVVNELFPYRIVGPNTKVHIHSAAYDYFHEQMISNGPQEMCGSAWIEDKEIGNNCFLKEEVRVLKDYDTVLSLIWISEDKNESIMT